MTRAERIFVAAACALIFGCTSTRTGDLTVASPKNLSHGFNILTDEVSGQECTHFIASIPFGELNPSVEGAVDKALEGIAGANALVDAVARRDILITGIYNRHCVAVKGKPADAQPCPCTAASGLGAPPSAPRVGQ